MRIVFIYKIRAMGYRDGGMKIQLGEGRGRAEKFVGGGSLYGSLGACSLIKCILFLLEIGGGGYSRPSPYGSAIPGVRCC